MLRIPGLGPRVLGEPGILYTEALGSHDQTFKYCQAIQGFTALVGSHFDTFAHSFA